MSATVRHLPVRPTPHAAGAPAPADVRSDQAAPAQPPDRIAGRGHCCQALTLDEREALARLGRRCGPGSCAQRPADARAQDASQDPTQGGTQDAGRFAAADPAREHAAATAVEPGCAGPRPGVVLRLRPARRGSSPAGEVTP